MGSESQSREINANIQVELSQSILRDHKRRYSQW